MIMKPLPFCCANFTAGNYRQKEAVFIIKSAFPTMDLVNGVEWHPLGSRQGHPAVAWHPVAGTRYPLMLR